VTRYLSLAESWYLAEHVTNINAATLIKSSRVELADSAHHAPQAGFGDTDFYPDLYDTSAALARRIACVGGVSIMRAPVPGEPVVYGLG
jgi:death-on-curing protein